MMPCGEPAAVVPRPRLRACASSSRCRSTPSTAGTIEQTAAEVRARIEERFRLPPEPRRGPGQRPARAFLVDGGLATVGIIASECAVLPCLRPRGHGGRSGAQPPVLAHRDRPARPAARRCVGCRPGRPPAGRDVARAQGSRHRPAGLRPARPAHVRDRRLTSRFGSPRCSAQQYPEPARTSGQPAVSGISAAGTVSARKPRTERNSPLGGAPRRPARPCDALGCAAVGCSTGGPRLAAAPALQTSLGHQRSIWRGPPWAARLVPAAQPRPHRVGEDHGDVGEHHRENGEESPHEPGRAAPVTAASRKHTVRMPIGRGA